MRRNSKSKRVTIDPLTPRGKAWAVYRVIQVLAAELGERLSRDDDVQGPRSPTKINAEWLTSVLAAHTRGTRVQSLSLGRPSVGTTTRASLELTYDAVGDAERLPRRLFVKCTSTLAQRLMLGLGGMIEGEPAFYGQVRPGLEIEAPIGYFGAVEARSWRSIVLIEDVISTRGAGFWKPSTQVTRDRIEDLLASVARWHGALWNSPRLAQWRWLRTPAEHMRLIEALIGMADRTKAGADRARPVIAPALRERQSDLYAGMRRSMQIASQGPPTYLHGDLHIANTYLTRDQRMGVADWQAGLRGSWAYDYAYLLATALEVEDRRAWEGELLDFYLDRLAAAGGEPIPRGQAWESYRRATFYPYFAWVYTIGRSRLQPHFQPDEVSLTMIERISAAIDDLGSLAAVGL